MASKKTDDLIIVALNSVGISLGGIAKRCGFHHTTITGRLRILNIPPADTRRAFMEDVFDDLSEPQQQWLIDQLGPNRSIKDFIKSLIVKEYIKGRNP